MGENIKMENSEKRKEPEMSKEEEKHATDQTETDERFKERELMMKAKSLSRCVMDQM